MRGASFHLKPVTSPGAAVVHNNRAWTEEHPAPGYLLPSEHSLGHWQEIATDIEAAHARKLALASGKAQSMKGYSPIWEGVLNLPEPTGRGDRQTMGRMVKEFVTGYEKITGHKVVAVGVHLDEGRLELGAPIYNAHAHVTVDRTDERGRPIRLTREQLRKVQDLAAVCTGLERGRPAEATGIKHLPHQVFRGLARAGQLRSQRDLEAEQQQAARAIDGAMELIQAREVIAKQAQALEAARTDAEIYGELRGLLKASGTATQGDYQEAKARREDRKWLEARIDALARAAEVEREALAPIAAAALPALDDRLTAAQVAGNWSEVGSLTYGLLPLARRLAGSLAPAKSQPDRWRAAVETVVNMCKGEDIAYQALWAVREIILQAGEAVPPELEKQWREAQPQERGGRGE